MHPFFVWLAFNREGDQELRNLHTICTINLTGPPGATCDRGTLLQWLLGEEPSATAARTKKEFNDAWRRYESWCYHHATRWTDTYLAVKHDEPLTRSSL